MRRGLFTVGLAVVATLAVSGCVSSPGSTGDGQPNQAVSSPAAAAGSSPGARAVSPSAEPAPPSTVPGALTLLTEPDQGVQPIYALITSARKSIDLTMYELVDLTAEQDLVAAARRGVDVRVLLDTNRERQANQPAFDELHAAGVHVVWAATSYAATHEKAMVVDGHLALLMTLNLTSRYYDSTRDFAVLDRDPTDVAAIDAVFNADFTHKSTGAGRGDDLVWSPRASEPALVALIAGARHTLVVENEEMASKPIIAALVAAAQRHVAVTVVMTDQTDWHPAFATLATAGVRIRLYAAAAPLYIHAKVLIADAATANPRAFVGSENFSTASLDHNRELGLITADPLIVAALSRTLASDAAGGALWAP